ncbi:MAG: peroxisomal biogenesis factor 11 [Monoraphidium minutum]|nr:MAG: peroxisomal biogenesis factor 11 [Monoraphidium minutum]
MQQCERDTLDKTVSFLQKREGVDKALKIIRYTARLIAAVAPEGSEAQRRFDLLQANVGNSRKAYRLGKFLQNVNGLRRSAVWGAPCRRDALLGALEAVTYAGEGVYYFLDQFIWLMKAGVISKTMEKRLSKVSAYSEAVGYAANIAVNLHRIRVMQLQELVLRARLFQSHKDGVPPDAAVIKQIAALRSSRVLRTAFVVQDLADGLLALSDITEGRYKRMSHPVVLALAGLVSAGVSSYKNWGT